jgi:tripartite-type tricarboxylate transporter receptor subunit TctC
LAGAAAFSAASGSARAQTWPTRPVRVIVPFQPGGSTDIFARLAAQKLTEHFGKQFYIENIAGATGNVGTAQAARAAPDGHTLLIAFSSYVVNPTLFAKLPFDPDKDLAPVTLAVSAPNVLTVNPSLPARNLSELVALIKSNPGKYTYTSGGVGTQGHLLGEMLRLSRARSARSSSPTSRRLPRPAIRTSKATAGSDFWPRLERRMRSSVRSSARSRGSSHCRT